MWMYSLGFILILIVIVYQDFRFRAISIWTLPFLFILAVILSLHVINLKSLLMNTAINLSIFGLEILLLIVYFSIKNKKLVSIFNSQIGVGDIVFIAMMCLLFSPLVFNAILVTGLFLTLVGYGLLRLFSVKIKTIPLAGCLSGMLAIIWTLKLAFGVEQLYTIRTIENLFIP